MATAVVYVPCWLYPWARTLLEYGGQKAELFVEENGFTRITIPANFNWLPGQHCFLRFQSFRMSALTSHPFTICSLPSTSSEDPSKVTFYVRHRGGFTSKLHRFAQKHSSTQVPVFVDGPYGGIDNAKYFGSDRLIVIAGGAGAGWSLPLIEQFLRHRSATRMSKPPLPGSEKQVGAFTEVPERLERSAPRSLRVILVTRDIATRTWFHAAVSNLCAQNEIHGPTSGLDIEVHLTGEAETLLSAPANVESDLEHGNTSSSNEDCPKESEEVKSDRQAPPGQEVRGRPDLPLVIREESATAAGTGDSVGVFVCGPQSMQDDVRNAVAEQNWRTALKSPPSADVYLHLEHFSWA